MPDTSFFSLLYDYGGLVIGFAILLLSTQFLPAKIRWYVLTAGLALIVFRGYQIYSARKKLAEADAERETLRAEHKILLQQLDTLQAKTEELRKQKVDIEAQRDRLREESRQLDAASDANLARKQALDARADELLKEGERLQASRDQQIDALTQAARLAKKYAIQ